jgi:hypothetical protein
MKSSPSPANTSEPIVGTEEDEVLATTACMHEIEAAAGMDDVVAGAGLDVVVAAHGR